MADVRLYEMPSIFTSAGWAALDAMVNDARSQAVVINQSLVILQLMQMTCNT